MSQSFRVFYYEDRLTRAVETKTLLERSPAKPDEPMLKVSHYAQAWDAFKAIDQWSGDPPDVALLDLHEPDYDRAGIDICERIKKNWPTVPVIMLSDYATIRDQNLGYKAGVSVYLSNDLRDEPDFGQLLRTILLGHIYISTEPKPPRSVYCNGSLGVNMNIPRIHWREKQVRLSPTDIDIVDELANDRNQGDLRTYRRLAAIGGLRGETKEQLEVNVRKHIAIIRKAFRKIDEEFGQSGYGIISVPGRGYRWETDEPSDSVMLIGTKSIGAKAKANAGAT